MKKVILTGIFIIFICELVLAADVPKYVGYVNDYANVLNNKVYLESMLSNLERNTTVEFVVVTLSSLPSDETKETYSYKILTQWGVGKKESNNGIVFLLITNQSAGNRMRLELGYGIEGYITDAEAGRILDAALPAYTKGDYSQATYVVVSQVISSLSNYVPGKYYSSNYNNILPLVVLIFIITIFVLMIVSIVKFGEKCPYCGSRELVCNKNYCTCRKCGRRFRRRTRFVFVVGGFRGGGFGGGGFGGFGGGSGGGGGAGR